MIEKKLSEIAAHQVVDGVKSISNKNATLLLFWVELYRRHVDHKQSLKDLQYRYSLEHIMPQKWEEYWTSVPVVDDDGKLIEDVDQQKRIRYSKIYSLGNMTLLNRRLNTSEIIHLSEN